MRLTHTAQMRGLLADYDTPTGLIWEMWVQTRPYTLPWDAVFISPC